VPFDQEPTYRSFLERVAERQGQGVILVVRDERLRHFVQQLVEGRFADILVASRAELGDSPAEALQPELAAPEASGVPA
jgi:flagellar biosynthesis component FlhA